MSDLRWGERTYLMGIINVTPDSFSGDGIALPGRSGAEVVAAALNQARGFVQSGADILDVGAESSRPAQFYGEHPALTVEAEVALAIPVVAALARASGGRALHQHRHHQGRGRSPGADRRCRHGQRRVGRATRPGHR